MIHIDIFSDTVCPWCLIGKRRLEKALAERPGLKPAIRWRVFQLNPTMPKGGMQRQAYLTMKFGGADNAATVYDRIRRAGAEDRSEEHTSELQSLMRTSYAVFCLKKKKHKTSTTTTHTHIHITRHRNSEQLDNKNKI